MSQHTAHINRYGTPMTVTYRYSRARDATLEQPAEEEQMSLSSVRIGGVESITEFSDDDLEDICAHVKDQIDAEADDYAEAQRDEGGAA